MNSPLLIGITGGTASGKTTMCKNLKKELESMYPGINVVIISQDSYYITSLKHEDNDKKNWDIPAVLEFSLLNQHIASLKKGENVDIPIWNFLKHERSNEVHTVGGAHIYLIEGIFVLNDSQIRDQLDLKIFVDVDSDTRLARRIKRDISERGRTIDSVLYQYDNFVKPGFENFTYPSKHFADIIVPYKDPNPVSESILICWIKSKLIF